MKDILRPLSITIALAISSSCAPVYEGLPTPSVPNTIVPDQNFAPFPTPSSLEIDLFKHEARKHYPELIDQNLPLAESAIIFTGNDSQEIRFFNLNEDFSLDIEAIEALVSTYILFPTKNPETIYQYYLSSLYAENQLRFPLDADFFYSSGKCPAY